jgi:multiple sugar transport system permease protein
MVPLGTGRRYPATCSPYGRKLLVTTNSGRERKRTLQRFAKIALPLTKPGLLASGVLSFFLTWNELFFALVITSSKARTASVGLATFLEAEGSVQWQLVAALGVMTVLPGFVPMDAMNRFMVRGLTMGALKG